VIATPPSHMSGNHPLAYFRPGSGFAGFPFRRRWARFRCADTYALLPNLPLLDQGRLRRRGRGWVGLSTRVPVGPVPLAARGLAAVLARAGPAGHSRRCAQPSAVASGIQADCRSE
jgi:hypothetical protein